MATLDARFQFDIDLLNLNWFIENLDSYRIDQNVFDPWEDRFTLFTPDEAVVLHGTGFGYYSSAKKDATLDRGTVEALSQWFYDDVLLAWTEAFLLSDIELSSREVFDAVQTASPDDDFALLEEVLSGNDMFIMSGFADNVRGFDGNDTMYGLAGADTLRGDDGNDVLQGDSGDDKLLGGLGKDMLLGGLHNDTLRGGDDRDVLRGGDNDDRLFGDAGDDKLLGGNDNDVLRGGAGNDVLRGGEGRDKISGGAGEDLFKFKTGDGVDIVRDFEVIFFDHDRIDLSGLKSVSGWNDLRNNHMEQDGADVVIDGGDGDLLILRDTDIGSLVKVFFEF